jgi:membrane peptidoglycan carboxypeptidase
VPSVALGAGEVTLAAITSAYGAFANGGQLTPPSLIRKVIDADGVVLFESAETPRQVIKPITAYLMADMLRGVIDAGTGSGARRYGFALPAGGKTGTTNDYKDAWFVGFTPPIATRASPGRSARSMPRRSHKSHKWPRPTSVANSRRIPRRSGASGRGSLAGATTNPSRTATSKPRQHYGAIRTSYDFVNV